MCTCTSGVLSEFIAFPNPQFICKHVLNLLWYKYQLLVCKLVKIVAHMKMVLHL